MQLELMDQNGIAAAVNSIASPGVYFGDANFASRLARECNEDSARMVANHPQRFGAFAILPLPDVGAAVREAEYALDTLKLEGVCLLTHVSDRHLVSPKRTSFTRSSIAAARSYSFIRCETRRRTCRPIIIRPA